MLNLEKIFTDKGIPFELYHHQAIFTNEDALVIKSEQGFSGTETKSLYLKDKQSNNYIYLTYTTKRSDFKALNHVIGKRLSVVSPDVMEEQTGQKPGAVSPFGYRMPTPVIIDEDLLSEEKLVFAPGRPDQTMVIWVKDLEKIIDILDLKTYILPVASNTDSLLN
ncbi:prolyl-tRNA editing protein [Vagococcus penaei]|uniref:Prolyl-tRNA editing protein n=1 Tax=Vagococcus penaei TaxID=633807 RepID=A0A1Q2D4U5_9ENTE|nr:YbaK/EbsC family protein [Vagococcus penaei]AQP53403.1 prolyl-tRNA editing protein [Vagococcus penaei]RST98629.1 prolyl-tRNA editing protein [Vagococcus penaei]